MSARIALEIERLEAQQMHIIGCTKENKEILEGIQDGLKENVEMIRKNVEFLKARGLNKEKLQKAQELLSKK